MEWIALLVIFGLALGVAFAVGHRNKAYSEFVKKRDEVAGLRKQLADLEAERVQLQLQRAEIRRDLAALRLRGSGPNDRAERPATARAKG